MVASWTRILINLIDPAYFGGKPVTRKLFPLAMIGPVGFALIAPLGGCNDEPQIKPTIDTTSPFKAPAAPTTQKVEVQKHQ